MDIRLKEIFDKRGINTFGVLSFSDVERLIPCRAASRIPSSAKSVILCLFPYALPKTPPHNVCRYAFFEDYHVVIGEVLGEIAKELSLIFSGDFQPFTDNSPIPEIDCCVKAGLGVKGKNGLLINQKYGSYLLIGELVTDVYFEPSLDLQEERAQTSCMNCGRCKNACPTGAIVGNDGCDICYEICVSHISQKKGELSEEEQNAIRKTKLAWGCDICQECCPHNQTAEILPFPPLAKSIEPMVTEENLDELLKSRPYGYRGKNVTLRNLNILKGE